MTWLSDGALQRLRQAAETPDLSATRYRLVERIGRGGMGVVFLAEDQTLGRRVALKVLDLPDEDGDLAGRLLCEARIVAQLEHPGIVPVHDAGTLPDGRVFYAMKFVQGRSLAEHAQLLASTPDRLRIFQKLCDAVAFAHSRRVLHRDLKPENVMIGPSGEVLVMDWGVAKLLRDPAGGAAPAPVPESSAAGELRPGTRDGAVIGTPGYMSPEQARGESTRIDARTDVFALGMILRFLLAGEAGSIPAPLAAVCAKATRADALGRYASVASLAADVARYLDGLPLEAYPDTVLRRAGRFFRRHQVVIWLVVAYVFTRSLLILFARH
jgi:serine/threonine protein kinase